MHSNNNEDYESAVQNGLILNANPWFSILVCVFTNTFVNLKTSEKKNSIDADKISGETIPQTAVEFDLKVKLTQD